jgi:hypothetical protein
VRSNSTIVTYSIYASQLSFDPSLEAVLYYLERCDKICLKWSSTGWLWSVFDFCGVKKITLGRGRAPYKVYENCAAFGSARTCTYCTVSSSDFRTLSYFKLIWIAEKILRSNYKIRVYAFLAISCENGVNPKKCKAPYIRSENYFSWNRSIWASKDPPLRWFQKCKLT